MSKWYSTLNQKILDWELIQMYPRYRKNLGHKEEWERKYCQEQRRQARTVKIQHIAFTSVEWRYLMTFISGINFSLFLLLPVYIQLWVQNTFNFLPQSIMTRIKRKIFANVEYLCPPSRGRLWCKGGDSWCIYSNYKPCFHSCYMPFSFISNNICMEQIS